MTCLKSTCAAEEEDSKWADTSPPSRWKAGLLGIRIVVLGLVFIVKSSRVEKTAAMKLEYWSSGSAVVNASEGGTMAREMKYMMVSVFSS